MRLYIVQSLWLTLPVIVTGILHMVIVAKNMLPQYATPIDEGKTFGGVRIFGDNKTWRGFIVMIVGSGAVGIVQGGLGGLWAAERGIACIDYARLAHGWMGDGALAMAWGYMMVNSVLGLGYVLGELPNSFIKRRLQITPGKTQSSLLGKVFFVVDQADSVIAVLLAARWVYGIHMMLVWVGIVLLTGVHLFINGSLYALRLRRNL